MTDETVLVGEFSHETNTFSPTPTDRSAFRDRREYEGEALIERLQDTNSSVGGFVDVAKREGVELVPTVAASATPGGVVTNDAYTHYTGILLDALDEYADKIDGVALSLHGAMVQEGGDDGEGPLLSTVRETVGPDKPIVATLDLHGNVTDEMCAAADALVAYETYPHVDTGDTGRTAMAILVDVLRTDRSLSIHVERPPILPYGPLQNTRSGPMADVMDHARDLEAHEGVEKVNVFPGFAKADIPSMGPSVVVVGDDSDAVRDAARTLATDWWNNRERFVDDFPDATSAVAEALDLAAQADDDAGPIVLADTGDNPGGGGTADETSVLRALIKQGATDAGLALICDSAAVDACIEAGVGEHVSVELGGAARGSVTDPCPVTGYVTAVTDGEFCNTGPMGTGTEIHLGRTVRLRCGTDDGIDVVLTEKRVQPLDAELWRHVGVRPERFDVVAVKSNNHYRAAYEPMATTVVTVDSPGLAAFDPHRWEYEHATRSMYPLDDLGDDDYPDWRRATTDHDAN